MNISRYRKCRKGEEKKRKKEQDVSITEMRLKQGSNRELDLKILDS